MKNHKGSQKAFDRYMDSELYDDYLEDYDDYSYYSTTTAKLDQLEAKLSQKTPSKPNNNKPPNHNDPTTSKKSSQNPAPVPVAKLDKPLTSQMLRDLALLIGPEAKNCYFNLKEIKSLKDPQVLQTFRDIYTKFETVPVLFLSLVNYQVVYLWQVNKKCPYQKGTDIMVLDSKAQKLDVMPHPSLLVLAKIKPFKGEQILDAKLISDTQLLIKSRNIEKKHFIFRIYKVKDFLGTSKVNPYNEQILAGDVYSHELQVKLLQVPDSINSAVASNLEFSLFKRTNIEDLTMEISAANIAVKENDSPLEKTQSLEKKTLIEVKTCTYPEASSTWSRDALFSDYIFDGAYQRLFMFDKETGTVLRWQKNDIAVENDPQVKGSITSITKIKEDIFFTSNDLVYRLNTQDLKFVSTGTALVTYPIVLENVMTQPRKFSDIVTFCEEPYAIMLVNTIFRSSPIGKFEDHHKDLFSIKDQLKTAKNFTWTTHMMGHKSGSATPIMVYICNNYLYVRNLYRDLDDEQRPHEEKIIILPFSSSETSSEDIANNNNQAKKTTEKTAQKDNHHKPNKELKQSWDWEIIGFSSKKLYLCKKFLNQTSVQLVEMNLDVSIHTLFSEFFVPEFQQIKKEDYYLLPLDGEIFAQMDRKEEIVFVSFENEPFYHDEVNLMYNVPMSLKNPQEIENKAAQGIVEEKKIEDNDKENKNYFKKMERTKTEISHKKDVKKGLEESKEALKSLRGNISTKMGEVQEFNKKYLDQEKNPKKENEKVKLNDPGKVNKESVHLYQEIKTEKKKINKQRDKEKSMRNKGEHRSQY